MRELHIEPMGGKDTIVEANEKYVGAWKKINTPHLVCGSVKYIIPYFSGIYAGKVQVMVVSAVFDSSEILP